MDAKFFLSVDGDAIGQKIGRASLSDDLDGLTEMSEKIKAGNDHIAQFAESRGGQVISNGGDELNIILPELDSDEIETLREDYRFITGATLSVGIGSKLSEANKALHVAKIRGKNQTLMFSPEVEQEWAAAQENVNNGTASGEAKKIGEAYMTTKEQPNGQIKDDCPACEEYDSKNTAKHSDDCPMCKEYDGAQTQDSMSDDCPACKEYDGETKHSDDCSMCNDYDEKDGEPTLEDGVPENEIDNCPDCQALLEGSNDPDEAPSQQGLETKDDLIQQIDEAPTGEHPTPEEVAQSLDDTDLPQGQASDGDASVPENYGDAQESDLANQPGQVGEDQGGEDQGDEEDSESPDMAQVLTDGLNDNEDEIKRQKVIDMVSRALMSFKNQKDVLEQAKAQFPDFYVANIQMLRCMIELCKLLGLEPKRNQAEHPSPNPGPQTAPVAAPQEEAAQSPQQ